MGGQMEKRDYLPAITPDGPFQKYSPYKIPFPTNKSKPKPTCTVYHRPQLSQMSLIKGTDLTGCRLCDNGIEDSWHLLTQCDALAVRRHAAFYTDDVQKLPHPRLVLNLSLIHI